jgi:hypothetical protein
MDGRLTDGVLLAGTSVPIQIRGQLRVPVHRFSNMHLRFSTVKSGEHGNLTWIMRMRNSYASIIDRNLSDEDQMKD